MKTFINLKIMDMMSKVINIKCAKGFVDKTPIFMKERQRILEIIDSIYKRHGAEKLETPVFELKVISSFLHHNLTDYLGSFFK